MLFSDKHTVYVSFYITKQQMASAAAYHIAAWSRAWSSQLV
jgi:hypothetical protein